MAALSDQRIFELLEPYLAEDKAAGERCVPQLSAYLDLLLRWNERTNLTAIREPEEIVRRHFGESLFAAWHLRARLAEAATVLDFGSGAGFPGIPLQLYAPDLQVTLAESQGKKSSFLREAVRTLGLTTAVWDQRVEAMPIERRFDCVTLRAVDRMELALTAARTRVSGAGVLAVLGSKEDAAASPLAELPVETIPLPGLERGELRLFHVEQSRK